MMYTLSRRVARYIRKHFKTLKILTPQTMQLLAAKQIQLLKRQLAEIQDEESESQFVADDIMDHTIEILMNVLISFVILP